MTPELGPTSRWSQPRWVLAAVALLALLVISPSFFLGPPDGHDFVFHISSWRDIAQQWREGVAFPRWAEGANWRYGDPRFIFYPPVSMYLGALLGLAVPWVAVPCVFIFLCLLLGGASMYRLARAWLPPEAAAAAALIYAANPYQLIVVYVRSDFAELLAASLLPLAVHYALQISARESESSAGTAGALRNSVALALVYGGIWLTNAPAAVVTSYALALLLLVAAAIERSWRPLLWGGVAISLGLALASVYVVPAAVEQRWVNIGEALSGGLRPDDNFLYSRTSDPLHDQFNSLVSNLGAIELLGVAIGAAVARRRTGGARLVGSALAALAAGSLVMMLRVTLPIWRYAPKLRFVQFPWRSLLVLGVSFAFFAACAFAASRRRRALALVFAAAIGFAGFEAIRNTWWYSQDDPSVIGNLISAQGYEGSDEYVPFGGDRGDLPDSTTLVTLLPASGDSDASAAPLGKVDVDAWGPERKSFVADAPEASRAELHLLNYPAWQVDVNGRRVVAAQDSDTVQMIVPLPAGHDRVELRFARTRDRTAGDLLSAGAALVLAVMWIVGVRPRARAA
jgi:uncharacterized membrane protein